MISTFKHATDAVMAQIAEEKKVRQTDEVFLFFALGSQFDHLIKQALEKLGVFCLVADPGSVTAFDVSILDPIGIILSGGPASVHSEPPPFDSAIFDLGIPVLGICLGFQMWAKHVGATVATAERREFGTHTANLLDRTSSLFYRCPSTMPVLESHGDSIQSFPKLKVLASTANAPVAAAQCGHLYGVQFHPEVTETSEGVRILENFCFRISAAQNRFPAADIAQLKIKHLKSEIGDQKVLLALSGGSDSSIVAHLLKEAVSGLGQICAIYIKGIDRPDDESCVLKYFGQQPWLELQTVDAAPDFISALRGITTMHEKRVAMRGVYKGILEAKAKEFGAAFIAQGTLYTDISESGGGYDSGARKAIIKLHHNTNLGFLLPELTPLDDCVKDGGRNIGRSIGVPEELLIRHPFPGPGLVVRILGEVNADSLRIARAADSIYIEELRRWNLYGTVWQAGATLTQSTHTCTKGDGNATGLELALWAVWSVNGFTAQCAELPYDFLKCASRRIANEIKEVGVVTYRISDKPPATIEWG